MNPCMYILAEQGTTMTDGKLAAQVAHAAVEAYRLSPDKNVKRVWDRGGHYMKVVLGCDDLNVAERYIRDRGFKTALIIDEGRTEFDNVLTPTALGVEIVDKDDAHVAATFSAFKTFKPRPVMVVVEVERISRDQLQQVQQAIKDGNLELAQQIARVRRPEPETRSGRPLLRRLFKRD